MINQSPPKDLLDEIFRNAGEGINAQSEYEFNLKKEYKLKAEILTHYISIEDVLKLIGEDEPIPNTQLTTAYGVVKRGRNQLKAELKAALMERRESNG